MMQFMTIRLRLRRCMFGVRVEGPIRTCDRRITQDILQVE